MVRVHDEAIVCQFQRTLSLAVDQADVQLALGNGLLGKLDIDLRDIPLTKTVWGHSKSSLRMQHLVCVVCDARDDSVMIESNYVLTFFDRQTGKRTAIPSFIVEKINE